MNRRALIAVLLVACTLAAPERVSAGPAPQALQELRHQDLRLAGIADRMLVANRDLCIPLMPVTGIILHSRDQYGPVGDELFAYGKLAIWAVIEGSPAALAGLAPGDAIVAIGAHEVEHLDHQGGAPLRDLAFDILADAPGQGPLELRIRRGAREIPVVIEPDQGCRALVEIITGDDTAARSDGRVIQIGHTLASELSDEALAAVFAHELGHLVLQHRRRLSEMGVSKGFFAEFGRNRRLNREAEIEADRMSAYLLANSGFDPWIAPRFWLSPEGRRFDAGIFRSAIYPSRKDRAELIGMEIESFYRSGGAPWVPRYLLERREHDRATGAEDTGR